MTYCAPSADPIRVPSAPPGDIHLLVRVRDARQTLPHGVERPRRVKVRSFPSERRLVTAPLRAGKRKAPMHELVDVDVTKARKILASLDPPSSVTAFAIASVARAAAALCRTRTRLLVAELRFCVR